VATNGREKSLSTFGFSFRKRHRICDPAVRLLSRYISTYACSVNGAFSPYYAPLGDLLVSNVLQSSVTYS